MSSALRRVLSPLFGHRARIRWAYLVLGGALYTPFFFLAIAVGQFFGPFETAPEIMAVQFGAWFAGLPLAAIVGMFPLVGTLERAAVQVMLDVPADKLTAGTNHLNRLRTACWFVLHVGLGGLVAGMSLATPPAVIALWMAPFVKDQPQIEWFENTYGQFGSWSPLLGCGLLIGVFGFITVAGALLARMVPVFLGASPADRLAAAEARAASLAERNRLARELHDSVGHTLSVITIQAGAARHVLADNPDFAAKALAAIETAGRSALGDLDHVLGVLRDDASSKSVAPDLGAVTDLVNRARLTGADITTEIDGDLGEVPILVSREAYRIVQEGLTNAVRHAAAAPMSVSITVNDRWLSIAIVNPLRAGESAASGGRGLLGISERVAVLGGTMNAASTSNEWHLAVEIPLRKL